MRPQKNIAFDPDKLARLPGDHTLYLRVNEHQRLEISNLHEVAVEAEHSPEEIVMQIQGDGQPFMIPISPKMMHRSVMEGRTDLVWDSLTADVAGWTAPEQYKEQWIQFTIPMKNLGDPRKDVNMDSLTIRVNQVELEKEMKDFNDWMNSRPKGAEGFMKHTFSFSKIRGLVHEGWMPVKDDYLMENPMGLELSTHSESNNLVAVVEFQGMRWYSGSVEITPEFLNNAKRVPFFSYNEPVNALKNTANLSM